MAQGTYTGEMLQQLIEDTDLALSSSKPIRANCQEVVAGGSTREDDIICRAATFEHCGECETEICGKHEVVCKNCTNRFCRVCFQSHHC